MRCHKSSLYVLFPTVMVVVSCHVIFEEVFAVILFLTVLASIGLDLLMSSLVVDLIALTNKSLYAKSAFVGVLKRVGPVVDS
jgi:hypothetical protein